jgi:hypothetical protein
MELLGLIMFAAIFALAIFISCEVDDEPRSLIEARRYLARNGHLPF